MADVDQPFLPSDSSVEPPFAEISRPPGQFFPADAHGKFFLDICAGFSAPVSTALTKLGGARAEPVDLLLQSSW